MSTTRWFSLRRRLLALLLGGVTLGWSASLALSYHDAHHEIDEIFDANLVQVAQMLLALASEYDDDDDIARLPADVHKYQKKIVFQLWTEDGYLLLRSRHAPMAPLTQEDGFSEAIGADQARWRYYNQWDVERDLRAVVGENHEVRQELAANIASILRRQSSNWAWRPGLWHVHWNIDGCAAREWHRGLDALCRSAATEEPDSGHPRGHEQRYAVQQLREVSAWCS